MTPYLTARPAAGDYAPFYAGYVDRVPPGDILEILATQIETLLTLLGNLSEAQASFRPAPHEWSIKEIVGHLSDTERIFAYRALRFARGDATPLAGFEQDDYVRLASFDSGPLAQLSLEFKHIRQATVSMFQTMSVEAWSRRGVANQVEFTVRALAYIIAGHERHHLESIQTQSLGPHP